jgi:hypothetical protein
MILSRTVILSTVRVGAKNMIQLPCYGICVTLGENGSGRISSDLHDHGDTADVHEAWNAIESLILAHACAGIDITTPAYVEGVETAINSVFQNLL